MTYDEDGNAVPDGMHGLGSGASGDWESGIAPTYNYVTDPYTGLPMADPSGVLRAMGYETSPADTVQKIVENTGNAAAHAAEEAANIARDISDNAAKLGAALFTGGKWLVAGIIGIAVIEAVTAGRSVLPKRRR